MDRILIIDGNSLINRAYFAVQGLTNKEGTPTNALFGFLQMFQKLLNEYDPTHITVAFDMKSPTFRHLSYAAYKGTRKGMPDELRVQMPIIKELLDYMGIHRLELKGFEADDLIGTVARIGDAAGAEVYVATGDRDALQLATERTRIIYHGTKGNRLYDSAAVQEEYGISPEQVPDHKGLTGDVSDNIPGVPGIGKVTASKLLQKFQTLEAILERTDEVTPPRIKELIESHRENAAMSKRLATIETHVPIHLELDEIKPAEPDNVSLLSFYRKYGLTSLLAKLQTEEAPAHEAVSLVLSTVEEVTAWCERSRSASHVILQVLGEEGNVRRNRCHYLLGLLPGEETVIIPEALLLQAKAPLKALLEDPATKIMGHNVKKAILILRNYDILLEYPAFDTMLASYLLEPQRKNQDPDILMVEYLEKPLKDYAVLKKIEPHEDLLGEAVPDAVKEIGPALMEGLSELIPILQEALLKGGLLPLFDEIEMPLVTVLADMEYEGFAVDPQALRVIGEELDVKIAALTESIYADAGEAFNINSPKQLGVILFEKLRLATGKKTKTGYSTGQDVLDKLRYEHPIVEKVLEFRIYSKLKSTYVDGLYAVINPDTGRIHSSLNQTIAITGRLSSTEPNLQNIPMRIEEGRRIRKVFIPRDGDHILVDADYSQIELRVLAHMSQDPGMIQAFADNLDIHTATAAKIFNLPLDKVTSVERGRAKVVNFGIVYGMSDYGLAENLGIPRKTAQEYIDQYFTQYAGVKKFMDGAIAQCRETGFVQTLFNRRRFIPEINAVNFNLRSIGERTAMNTPIQGTAADIIKLAMVRVYRELKEQKLESRLILQVHDELIIDAPASEQEQVIKLLREAMEEAGGLSVPLLVELKCGKTWYDTK